MSEYLLRTLFVHTPGTRLVLDAEAVKALRDDAPPRRLPLQQIDTIVVAGGVDVSTPLLIKCAEDGRTIAFVSKYGKPRAVVEGAMSGRGRLRRHQYIRHLDDDARTSLAADVVRGKLGNLAWAMRQWRRDASGDRADRLHNGALRVEELMLQLRDSGSRAEVMGVEGAATRVYFGALGAAMRDADWTGRSRRPARDPVNACLSWVYGMTRIAALGALHVVGLDPYCGFLHGDTDGQPSLALDLMEEFRPSSDRIVVSLLNRRQLRDEHFVYDVLGTCSLTAEGRDVLMGAWHKHRASTVAVHRAQVPIKRAALPIVQANVLANALRTASGYEPHQVVLR